MTYNDMTPITNSRTWFRTWLRNAGGLGFFMVQVLIYTITSVSKRRLRKIIQLALVAPALVALSPPADGAERKPLTKPQWDLQVIEPSKEFLGVNPETGEEMYYDSGSEITFDSRSGNYILGWESFDGKKKFEVIWEPQTKVEVVIEAKVRALVETHTYEYQYVLANRKTSRQKLQTFVLHCPTTPIEADAPDKGWRSSRLPESVWEKTYWLWSDVNYMRLGIKPGNSQNGFRIRSAGLPAIVECYAAGDAPALHSPEELPRQISKALHSKMKLLANGVFGVTVGPGEVCDRTSPSADELLNKLLEYTRTSLEQGWIETPEIADRFLELLSSAKLAVQEENSDEAIHALRSVIDEVQRQISSEKKGLMSEAHALLKFNASYLLDRLQSNPIAPTPQQRTTVIGGQVLP